MERSIMNVRRIHKIRHSLIRQQTKITDALAYTLKAKWKWAGHVARLTDNRWTLRLTKWPGPTGNRARGRPHYRWEDDIKNVAAPN
ncbi:jg22848 [Pararge aegeria aegeria]|uniref:Jg22848 protein n=1 Tax=Pararge aegeria aegeria TaxID=348720 RepID=A0A8S4QRH9_9NEOP|nr:jg22848 [Pararge aegeria aegeria]